MIKAIVIPELSALDGHEGMSLGIQIASETEYKYVWYCDPNRMIIGNVQWGTIPGRSDKHINGILRAHYNSKPAYKILNTLVHVYDWGMEVVL